MTDGHRMKIGKQPDQKATVTKNRNTMKPQYLIASIALLLPLSAFADNPNQEQKKLEKQQAGGQRQGGKSAPQGVAKGSPSAGGEFRAANVPKAGKMNRSSGGQGQGHANRSSGGATTAPQTKGAQATSSAVASGGRGQRTQQTQSAQVFTKGQRNQTQVAATQQRYNRGNNFGGLWFPANSHVDWNRSNQYSWNHHNYRWYEGGWLIIDAGYNPFYVTTGYSYGGSSVRNVQVKLADQGYYRGPIDGDIGPGTRNGIANYQADHELRVTGRINDPLLQSLGLE